MATIKERPVKNPVVSAADKAFLPTMMTGACTVDLRDRIEKLKLLITG